MMWPISLSHHFDPTGAPCLPVMISQQNPVQNIKCYDIQLRVRNRSDLIESWTLWKWNENWPGDLSGNVYVPFKQDTVVTLNLKGLGATNHHFLVHADWNGHQRMSASSY
jgi:hypothetical protein